MNRWIFLVVLALALSACNEPASDSANTGATTPAPPTTPVSLAKNSENGMLTVDPAIVRACPGADAIAAKVRWNATSAGTEGIQLWMQGPGEEKKLWSAAGAVGEGDMGPWLREGSAVILVNGEDKKELARIVIAAVPCG